MITKSLKKILCWITGIVVVLFFIYVFLTPVIIQWQAQKWLARNGENNIKIERVDFNPFTSYFKVHSLIAGRDGSDTLNWQRAAFEIRLVPLLKQRLIIRDLSLRDAFMTIQKTKNDQWVFGGLKSKRDTGKGKKRNQSWEVGIFNVNFTNVRLHYMGPDINKTVLFTGAHIDTFMSWKPRFNTHIKFKAYVDTGFIDFSGQLITNRKEQLLSARIRIDSLQLSIFNPWLSLYGLSDVKGKLYSSSKITGNLNSKNGYSFTITGQTTLSSLRSSIPAQTAMVTVSEVNYKGDFSLANDTLFKTNGLLSFGKSAIINVDKNMVLLDFENASIDRLTIDGKKTIYIGNTYFYQLKSLAYQSSSGFEPFPIKGGSLIIESASIKDFSDLYIKSISARAFNFNIIRESDKKLRIANQLTTPSQPTKNGKTRHESKSKLRYKIDHLKIDNSSSIIFVDKSTSPYVNLKAHNLLFVLENYSNSPDNPGYYNLNAKVHPESDLTANGTVYSNPVPYITSTISAQLKQFELNQISPYLQDLFGYRFLSGRMNANLDLKITKGNLDGTTDMKIRNISLSPYPSSPAYKKFRNIIYGISLPTAISMLTDKNGDTNLKIPITGDLSKPDFHYSDLIQTGIINSLKKAITTIPTPFGSFEP